MRNIKVKQLIVKGNIEDYYILEMLKPVNSFAKKSMNINTMPWVEVKYCIKHLRTVESWGTVKDIYELCFKVTEKEFFNARIVEFYQSRKYLLKAFEDVIIKESKLLSSTSTDGHLWKQAGGDKLNIFSDTLPLIQLGKEFGIYPYDLGKKPYSEVLSLLVQSKRQNEVEAEYQKLKYK